MLCCALTILVNKIQIHTKDESEKYEETSDNNEAQYNKTVKLTIDMCKLLYGTEATVNMDNYYMPTATAIKLRDDKVLCRGTIHLTQCCYHKVFYSCQQKPSSPHGAIHYAQ